MQKHKRNHYDFLDDYLLPFCLAAGVPESHQPHRGLIFMHGDKVGVYRQQWEAAGIPFAHAVCIYMLSYLYPFKKEARDAGVAIEKWVADNYQRFLSHLPPDDTECREVEVAA